MTLLNQPVYRRHDTSLIFMGGSVTELLAPKAATDGAVMRYFAPLRCRALVNIAQFSKLTSWEFRVVYFGERFAILLAWIARQRVNAFTPPAHFAVSQFFMSAAMRSCAAFLMASDRFNPGGNLLACARASDARAAQS